MNRPDAGVEARFLEQFHRELTSLAPRAVKYWAALSGGRDSTVLLHALVSLRPRLTGELVALHVDHGLSPRSGEWSRHCQAFCSRLGVPCVVIRVNARGASGESPEAAARQVRYAAMREHVGEGEVLLTAHHQDDQAETLLLQLLRGSGPRGLAAMPRKTPFGKGYLIRPLLSFTRAELESYAVAQGLTWVDDPSNFDTGFDRNFLRHEIFPRLRQRRPTVSRVLARSAAHFAEAATLLDVLAEQDLKTATGERVDTLSIPVIRHLDPARSRNLLRYWFRQRKLPVPDTVHLERILKEVVGAGIDAEPEVRWTGAVVRRYRDRLYALPPLPDPPRERLSWQGMILDLPAGLGRLRLEPFRGAGLRADIVGRLTVGFRGGGERCRPTGRGEHRHPLKKLLQERGVPPWERERLPLVYLDKALVAVADLWVCEPYAAEPGKSGMVVRWDRMAIETEAENKEN